MGFITLANYYGYCILTKQEKDIEKSIYEIISTIENLYPDIYKNLSKEEKYVHIKDFILFVYHNNELFNDI